MANKDDITFTLAWRPSSETRPLSVNLGKAF